jgi:predicted regulator of Ras-like GTPase activity (Roadblock/LC7/MglB family)
MEEFVISDLRDSEFILCAAILDDQGFVKSSNPNSNEIKQRMSKFAEILFASDDFDKTSIITEHRIIIIHKLVRNFTLIVECSTNSNLGLIREEIASAASRLDTYFSSTSN